MIIQLQARISAVLKIVLADMNLVLLHNPSQDESLGEFTIGAGRNRRFNIGEEAARNSFLHVRAAELGAATIGLNRR